MINGEDLKYQIGISMIDGIGPKNAKKLISYCGGVQEVFNANKTQLMKIPGMGSKTVQKILGNNVLERAEEEVQFVNENNIQTSFYLNKDYPRRLVHCEDAPLILYTRGKMDLNVEKIISIVGTRRATEYGKDRCKEIIEELAKYNPLITSGLAYGVDIFAHKEAVKHNLQTVACVAHSLDRLYPAVHKPTADKMMDNGGLISEFVSGTKPDRENFPQRNRVIAGLADLTIVIESDIRGGSLITAEQANSYNRDVMAIPGRIGDRYSSGCNYLIKMDKANILTSPDDIIKLMGWNIEKKSKPTQQSLFVHLSADEEKLREFMVGKKRIALDELSYTCDLSISKTSSLLLTMEFKGVVKSLPGKIYELI